MPKIQKKPRNADIMQIRIIRGDVQRICALTGYCRDNVRRVLRGDYYNGKIIAAAKALMEKREIEGEQIRQQVLKEVATATLKEH